MRFAELRRLLDRVRHLARLAVAEADAAFLIAHDDKRRKAEAAATLDHFGDAIDVNELVHEFAVALFAVSLSTSAMWFSSHECTLSFFSGPSLSKIPRNSNLLRALHRRGP